MHIRASSNNRRKLAQNRHKQKINNKTYTPHHRATAGMAERCYRLGMAQLATLVNGIKQECTRQSCTNTNESKTHKIQTRHQQKPPVPGARTRHFRRTILCHKLSTTTASQHVQPKCEYRPCLRGINEKKKTSAPSHFPVLAHHVSREHEPPPSDHPVPQTE